MSDLANTGDPITRAIVECAERGYLLQNGEAVPFNAVDGIAAICSELVQPGVWGGKPRPDTLEFWDGLLRLGTKAGYPLASLVLRVWGLVP